MSDVIGRQRRAKLGVESNSSRRGRRMSTGGVSRISEGKGADLRHFVDALPTERLRSLVPRILQFRVAGGMINHLDPRSCFYTSLFCSRKAPIHDRDSEGGRGREGGPQLEQIWLRRMTVVSRISPRLRSAFVALLRKIVPLSPILSIPAPTSAFLADEKASFEPYYMTSTIFILGLSTHFIPGILVC